MEREWGIGISILGLLIVAISFEQVQKLLPMLGPLIGDIPSSYIIMTGAVLVIGGAALAFKFGEKK